MRNKLKCLNDILDFNIFSFASSSSSSSSSSCSVCCSFLMSHSVVLTHERGGEQAARNKTERTEWEDKKAVKEDRAVIMS